MINGTVIRGTTPTHEFSLPYDINQIRDLRITYGQANEIVLVRDINDCSFSDKKISVQLTQDDTLQLLPNKNVFIELRVLLNDGQVISNYDKPIILRVVDCLNSEVLS